MVKALTKEVRMSYTVSLQRNPNLSIPQIERNSANEVQNRFGRSWWTGLPPQDCPGFNAQGNFLQSLPLLNLDICTRQDILDYFNNTWTLTELLFSGLKNEATFIRPPYHELRHPLIFYYGHPAVLYYNKMRLAGLVKEPIDLYLEKILETGVDEMSWDDMSKNQMIWPDVQTVREYRQKVYNVIVNSIRTHPDLEFSPERNIKTKSPFWSLFMGFEHEKIHFETSSVLIRELPLGLVDCPTYWAPMHDSAKNKTPSKPTAGVDYPQSNWVRLNETKVAWGKPLNAASFGWDNEYGQRAKSLKDFQVTENLISNGEFYSFVSSLGYINDKYWSQEGLAWRKFRNTKRPTFWVAHGPEGLHDYKLRTIFEVIDKPWSWPAEVNFHEAQAYCHWKQEHDNSKLKYRLLTEPEHIALRESQDSDPVLQKESFTKPTGQNNLEHFNANFRFSSPNPVDFFPKNSKGIRDLFGNVWQWTEDQFNPLEGFEVHFLYDDFSRPCFDGKHQMILGGSFISCGHEASKWARFHFRPHFFQHAGFRISATLDGSDDNGSTKILKVQEYIHPQRENSLAQMEDIDWWKNVNQPLELTTDNLNDYWDITKESLLQFETEITKKSPMGISLDPASNDLKKDFRLAYQAVKDFPQRPHDYKKLLEVLFQELAPTGQSPGHPGYMAYVAGAGNSISNMAQAISQTLNQFTGHFSMAPGLVTLEIEALNWIQNMIGYPESTRLGFFTTGGSLATLSALSAAKKAKLKGYDLARARFYASENCHHCIGKSLAVLGFPRDSISLISTNNKFQMDLEQLKNKIQEDIQNGYQPVAVIATAGATTTGAVDDLEGVHSISSQFNLWLHVDGAYGGFFLLTEKGKTLLRGVEKSDSITLDPHKSFSLPYGTGCLLVRDGKTLNYDYAGAKTYMPPEPGLNEARETKLDFADITPELSRDYRGLRFWLPLKTLGVGPFQLNLAEKIQLAQYLYNELQKFPAIATVTEPQLSIVNFKLKQSLRTRELLTKINSSNKFFLTGCELRGDFVIRVCLLGFRTHYEQVQNLLLLINSSIAEMDL